MDIVKHINEHTKSLIEGLVGSSMEQRKSLTVALLGFYYQLPNFEETIQKYIKISAKKRQLIADINTSHVQNYQEAIEKSNAAVDVYADNYEEPEPIELFILDAFSNATSDLKFATNIAALFIGIIDTLDYYENFSDKPEFWNNVLEKEVAFQNEIISQLKSKQTFGAAIYKNRYEDVEFNQL
ncbi:hypothetical protein A0O34_21185 [Chryseobacterium glaciei]|uniref:Uncharacterized protein n=1 Tax=Chryseobacterium glaciei TaxID=1685010 RepID=A0A172Y0V7_9FLAO|nr:hypothetical protein [Chryseobacterium glaciei]ANF52879.1 hypothetical protein A0O34_21185 [Chryseobacterium glaciei]